MTIVRIVVIIIILLFNLTNTKQNIKCNNIFHFNSTPPVKMTIAPKLSRVYE